MAQQEGEIAMGIRRGWLIIGLLALFSMSLAACGGGDDGESGQANDGGSDPIIVGAALAEDGLLEPYDQPAFAAFKQRAEEINAEGGIDGRQIEFVTSDTRSDRAQAVEAANDVISQGADLVLVSCEFDFGGPAARVAQQNGVVSFSVCAQSPRFGPQGVGNLAFTPTHASYLEGTVLAEWAYEKLGARTAYVMPSSELAYQVEVCDSFASRFSELAGEDAILGTEEITNADTSIASTITRIRSLNPEPDVIAYCTYPPGGPAHLRQIRAAGLDTPIVSSFAMDGNYWLEAVPNLSDFYYTASGSIYGDDPDEQVNAAVEAFTKNVGEPPASAYALFGAVIVDLYKEAVEQAGSTDGEDVAAALESFENVPSLVGETTYTPETHISLDRPLRIMEIQNGKNGWVETWQVQEPPTLDLG